MRKMKKAEKALSEVVGTVMLLGMAVSLFSVLSIVVLTHPFNPSAPSVNIVGMIDGTDIILEHHGGEALDLDTRILIAVGGNRISITVRDLLDDESKVWTIGERLRLNYSEYSVKGIVGQKVIVSVVDVESNSLL